MADDVTLVDLVKITANTTGTGAITLGTAVPGYRGVEALLNGAVYSYSIQQEAEYEIGTGTYLTDTRQFVRSPTVTSDGGTAINLQPNATVAFVATAQDILGRDVLRPIYGYGEPFNDTGVVGQVYFDLNEPVTLYGPKTSAGWIVAAVLSGTNGGQGPAGPASNTHETIASLAASSIANKSAILAPTEGSGLTGATYTWKLGNFTGRNDVIASTYVNPQTGVVIPIGQGAWVLPNADATTFLQRGTGAVRRGAQAKSRDVVSVLDFGAKGDGTTDDTAAFNAAIDTGKAVLVPYVEPGYSVANIKVREGMFITGEKPGDSQSTPKLIVNTNGAAAFLNNAGTNVFNVTFEYLACEAGAGVTGAMFYNQTTAEFYSGYFTFRKIETYLSLLVGYKGLFIFALWDRPRDGYYGSPVNSSHAAIQALAGSYGQTNRQNINRLEGFEFFSSYGGQGAVIASYGTAWDFIGGDFEALQTAAFRGYNMTQVTFDGTWFEGINAPALIALSDFEGAGCSVTFNKPRFVMTNVNPAHIVSIGNGDVSFYEPEFNLVSAGMRVINNGDRIRKLVNPKVDGAGALNFLDGAHADRYGIGRRMLNGSPDNGIAGVSLQNLGAVAATGYMSADNIAVGTTFVTVGTSLTGLGGRCSISGFDPVGGAQFRFDKDWQGATIRDAVPALNGTPKVFTFQIVGNALQMRVDVGSVLVFTTLTS